MDILKVVRTETEAQMSRRIGLELQEVEASKNRMKAWVRDDKDEIKGGPCRECARGSNCTADIQDRNECWSPPGVIAAVEERPGM